MLVNLYVIDVILAALRCDLHRDQWSGPRIRTQPPQGPQLRLYKLQVPIITFNMPFMEVGGLAKPYEVL
jgi:hypothetical protein